MSGESFDIESIAKIASIPDFAHYRKFETGIEVFHPWTLDPDIAATVDALAARNLKTLVSSERLSVIKWAAIQTRALDGDVWEAGVYQGGVAYLLKRLWLSETGAVATLRLFDTFTGLPRTTPGIDNHRQGEFADTSVSAVKDFVGHDLNIDYRVGFIPATFAGLEQSRIRFAHIDLDLYQSTIDCLEFVYPRLLPTAIVVVDDYGLVSCPGVRRATDEFLLSRTEKPLVLPSGHALIVKL